LLLLLLPLPAGGRDRLSSTPNSRKKTASAEKPGGFFLAREPPTRTPMTTPTDNYLANFPVEKTSLTDDERIENIVPLPPPEHLIRFFPIQGTAVETLIAETRRRVRDILHGRSDRLLVVIGPCSIHDPQAALA